MPNETAMLTICDTHVLIFWQDDPHRLNDKARIAMEAGLKSKYLACSDTSFWEIAMLIRGRRLRSVVDAGQYNNDLSFTLSLTVLPMNA